MELHNGVFHIKLNLKEITEKRQNFKVPDAKNSKTGIRNNNQTSLSMPFEVSPRASNRKSMLSFSKNSDLKKRMSLDHKIFKDAALAKSKITTKKQDCGLNNQENLNFILNYYSNIGLYCFLYKIEK